MMLKFLLAAILFVGIIAYSIYKAFFSKYKIYIALPIIAFIMSSCVWVHVAERVFKFRIPDFFSDGSYVVLAFYIYLFLLLILFKLMWFCRLRFKFLFKTQSRPAVVAIVISLLLIGFGYFNHFQTRITPYILEFETPLTKPMRIAAISDIHIGSGMSKERLKKSFEKINSYNPDIVVIVGDTIDHNVYQLTPEYQEIFKTIKSTYGYYLTFGNHEYYSGPTDVVLKRLKGTGGTVLKDEVVYLEDFGAYLVGRDCERRRAGEGPRKTITKLTSGLNKSKPMIILDHIPSSMSDGVKAGAELQISGHTHAGQFFPITEIVKLMYPTPHGLIQEDSFNLVVLSGLGLWGPPLRIGSYSEIALIDIR